MTYAPQVVTATTQHLQAQLRSLGATGDLDPFELAHGVTRLPSAQARLLSLRLWALTLDILTAQTEAGNERAIALALRPFALTRAEVARMLGISQPTAQRTEAKALRSLVAWLVARRSQGGG